MSFSYIFPDEILLIIFDSCDVYTLFQISMVCKQFYRVSSTILQKKANYLLVTNQMSKKFRERCKSLLLSHNSKFIMHYKWKHGIYMKREICKISDILLARCYPDRLQMTENMVYFHNYSNLVAYNRAEDGTLEKNRIVGRCDSDIHNIVYCNNEIISGHEDGSIRHWRIESQNTKKYLQQCKIHFKAHNSAILNVDATTQHILSSTHSKLKLQKNIHEKDNNSTEKKDMYINIHCILSISLDPTGSKFAVSAFDEELKFLIFDIDKSYPAIYKLSDYVFQLTWEDPHTVLMCSNYCVNKIDIRTSKIVWNNNLTIYDDTLRCFSSDNLYTIMTGTKNGKIILWDQRYSFPIQTYGICSNESTLHSIEDYFIISYDPWISRYNQMIPMNSVHSIQFDSTYLYAITSKGLIEFDFKKGNYFNSKNIKGYFKNFF